MGGGGGVGGVVVFGFGLGCGGFLVFGVLFGLGGFVGVCRVKSLTCSIGREGYQLGSGVPCRIDTSRDGVVAFHIDSGNLAIVNNHSASIR